MKKHTTFLKSLCFLCLLAFVCISFKPVTAEAADTYSKYTLTTSKKHIGNYWFKTSSSGKTVYIASSKNGTYRKVMLSSTIVTNGSSYAYSVKDKYLYRVNLKTRSASKLKSLSSYLKGDAAMEVVAYYNGNVYMNWDSFDAWKLKLYSYKVSSKTMKLAKTNCNITSVYKNYALTQNAYRSDVSPYPVSLLKLTSSGVSTIKTLTSYSLKTKFANGKVYWCHYPNGDLDGFDIYRCNLDGTKKTWMFGFETNDGCGRYVTSLSSYGVYWFDDEYGEEFYAEYYH